MNTMDYLTSPLILLVLCTIPYLTVRGGTITVPRTTSTPSQNHVSVKPIILNNDQNLERRGYERDILVVLPVMQGDTDQFTNSNLQKLYTKSPVTAIIDEDYSSILPRREFAKSTSSPGMEKRVDTEAPIRKHHQTDLQRDRHRYTDFMLAKPTSISKPIRSPLDYGYPQSSKFPQQSNEFPSNHKHEWVDTPISPTKGGSFQIFDSVKPLETNKLLSLKPVVITVADDDTTVQEKHVFTQGNPKPSEIPRIKPPPPQKKSTKKPLNFKSSQQQLNEAIAYSVSSTTTIATSTINDVEPDYTALRYSNLLAETTKTLQPTSYHNADHVAALFRQIASNPSSPNATKGSTSSATISTIAPWTHSGSNKSTTDAWAMLSQITTKTPFPEDAMTNEVKNMLIDLGILKSETKPAAFQSFTSSTAAPLTQDYLANLFGSMVANPKREPQPPIIDPYSYNSFKKMPTNNARPTESHSPPVSNDMQELLASFGLLPKHNAAPTDIGNVVLTRRVSRGHKFNHFAEKSTSTSEVGDLFNTSSTEQPQVDNPDALLPEDLTHTLENLGLLQPLAYTHQPNRTGHVFQPAVHLEKLADPKKVDQINQALDAIRQLSKSKLTANLTAKQIEQQLENATAILQGGEESATNELHTDELDAAIKNATTSKIVETIQKISIPDSSPAADLKVHYSTDKSTISSVNLNSSTTEHEPINELNFALNQPNPLSSEELQNLLEFNKNDVKRQQPNDTISSELSPTNTSSESTITTPSETVTITSSEAAAVTTIEADLPVTTTPASSNSSEATTFRAESNNAPVSDLAESFGGGETASEGAPVNDMPTPRPNGVYFLLDWNTFLNVGESDKKPVRVRFAPRAGNPRNFLPITVP